MNVYVCYDGDKIGRQVGRAVRTNDVAEVRRVDQAINQGNEIWRSFALRVGGSVIEIGGDEGRIEIGIEHLPEVPDIARQYAEAVGATVSVGVGMVLSASADALAVAKIRGGNQILLWNPEMQAELDASIAAAPSESQKIADEYLVKADQHLTGKNRGAHAGFSGHHQGAHPTADKPKASQGDHDEAKVVEHEIEASKEGQPAPEQTHAAEDFESTLHSAAQDQEKQDGDAEVSDDGEVEKVKQQIVGVLGQIKTQMPMLQQIRASAPDVYQTIMNLVQGVILLGKRVMSNEPQAPVDGSDPQHVQAGLGKGEDNDACDDCGSMQGCNIDCSTCDAYWKKRQQEKKRSVEKDEIDGGGDLDKGAPAPSHHHLKLPVGSTHNGEIKVQHSDGKTGWIGVNSGMVSGQEPGAPNTGANTHPVSERKPSAK